MGCDMAAIWGFPCFAPVASRVASQKSFCESRFSGIQRDSQKLFCDATRDATAAKPGNPQIATIADPTQLTQLGHRRPSQKLSLAQLLRCDAMRQAIWRTILTFSTAKLYKGARVAHKFVQVVSNRAYGDVAKSARCCRITDFFCEQCEWYFASSHRTRPSQIASHRVSHRKKASVNPALSGIHRSFFAMRHAMRRDLRCMRAMRTREIPFTEEVSDATKFC